MTKLSIKALVPSWCPCTVYLGCTIKTQHSCHADKQLLLTVNQNFHLESVFVSWSAMDQFPPSLCPFTCIYKYFMADKAVLWLKCLHSERCEENEVKWPAGFFSHLISLPGPAVVQCIFFSFSFFSNNDLLLLCWGQNFPRSFALGSEEPDFNLYLLLEKQSSSREQGLI